MNNTDGNLAALDAHLKQIDKEEYEENWKENWLAEKVAQAYKELLEDGEFKTGIFKTKLSGKRYEVKTNWLNLLCEANELQAEDFGNIFRAVITSIEQHSELAETLTINLLEDYFRTNADKAFEIEHSDIN